MSQQRNEVIAALQARLEAAPERAGLAQLSSELGHAIARNGLDGAAAGDLARRIARWGRRASDADRTYLRALEDVLGAVSSALLDDEERIAIEHAVASKRDWARVLALLAEAPRGPNELAQELGAAKNNGRITKLLRELEELGLVQAAPSANGKSRPRRLTARGHRIARSPVVSKSTADTSEEGIRSVIAMLQLARRCEQVTARELLASFGGAGDQAPLVRRAMYLAEMHGLVDVLGDGTVRWGRAPAERAARLEAWGTGTLRQAFAIVPNESVLVTDLEDAWRGAIRRAEVDRIANVIRPTHAEHALRAETFAACVVDDPTYLESLDVQVPCYVADLSSEAPQLVAGGS